MKPKSEVLICETTRGLEVLMEKIKTAVAGRRVITANTEFSQNTTTVYLTTVVVENDD